MVTGKKGENEPTGAALVNSPKRGYDLSRWHLYPIPKCGWVLREVGLSLKIGPGFEASPILSTP